jgi:hypothetical protein
LSFELCTLSLVLCFQYKAPSTKLQAQSPNLLGVIEIEADAEAALMPVFVHQQEVPKQTVLIFGDIGLWVPRLQPISGVNELAQVEPVRYL